MNFDVNDWPSELHEVLFGLIDEWDIAKLERRRTVKDGRSGAHVFVVNISGRPLNGQAILKISATQAARPDGKPTDETQRHQLAWGYNDNFSRRCLPQLIDTFSGHGHDVLLMQLAAGSLDFSLSFKQLPTTIGRRAARKIIDRQLFLDWPRSRPIGEPVHWPIISTRALGEAFPGPQFAKFSGSNSLISGKIARIERGQLGFIDVGGLLVRFVPGQKFLKGQHEQRSVRFKLGFRYDGPVAWDPELVDE